jgi:hypothetical protein
MNQHQRSAWISCACCISNMTRFLPSLPGYVYAKNKNDLYVNLFMSNTSNIKLTSGNVNIVQTTDYPWKGKVDITVNPAKATVFTLRIRIPGWAKQQPVPGDLYSFMNNVQLPVVLSINGKATSFATEKGYAVLKRSWKKGDKVSLNLPMETEKVLANQKVKDDRDRFAFERGPIVYCLEGPDNRDSLVQNIMIDKNAIANANYQADLLNGVDVINAEGKSTKRQLNSDKLTETSQQVKAIPYYAWANRGPSEMTVWIPYEASASRPQPAPTIASTSKVSASLKNKKMFASIKDQYEPASSNDNSFPFMHWWPAKDTSEFVQYDFDAAHTVSESKVYWFDDGPWGGCRIPASYKILYKKDGQWVPVKNTTPYTISKDSFNTVSFEPVSTTALRMEIQLPVDNSAGIHEWAVK